MACVQVCYFGAIIVCDGAFLFQVKAQVLEQNYGAGRWRRTSTLDVGTNAIIQKSDWAKRRVTVRM